MALIPDTKAGKIAFFTARATPWTDNAVAIGSSVAAVTDMTTKLATAIEKYEAQVAAQAAAKAATAAADVAVAALVVAGTDIIRQVRIKAVTAGPGVYELAQIPAPATPSPKPAPGTPTGFRVELFQDGSLKLTWKCPNPVGATGTIYQVWRRAEAAGEFQYLGGSGSREFVDLEIPAGASQITYQIQAVRSTAVGAFAQFNVNFGTTSAGAMTASVSDDDQPAKIAA